MYRTCSRPSQVSSWTCYGPLRALYTRATPEGALKPRWTKVGTLCLRCKHLQLEPAFQQPQ